MQVYEGSFELAPEALERQPHVELSSNPLEARLRVARHRCRPTHHIQEAASECYEIGQFTSVYSPVSDPEDSSPRTMLKGPSQGSQTDRVQLKPICIITQLLVETNLTSSGYDNAQSMSCSPLSSDTLAVLVLDRSLVILALGTHGTILVAVLLLLLLLLLDGLLASALASGLGSSLGAKLAGALGDLGRGGGGVV